METVRLPALTVTVTVPEQAPLALAGRTSRPRAVKRYGPLRSRRGSTPSESTGAKRLTDTARCVLAVWPAPSTATSVSVLRPTSSSRAW